VEAARIFNEIADILEIKEENPFRIRSYRRAAQVIENLSENLEEIDQRGELEKIPGIGASIAEKIREIMHSGDCRYHRELTAEVHRGVLDMMRLPNVGPKKAALFYRELGIKSVDALEVAARKGKLASLPGMGQKSAEKILKGIEIFRQAGGRFRLSEALPFAETIVRRLKNLKAVERISLAGSLRRMKETIGDIDILVQGTLWKPIMEAFTSAQEVSDILAKGKTKSTVRLRNGIQVDLRILEKKSFGAALHYFTGSKQHNIAIRERGRRMGLKISEYGVFNIETGRQIGGADEKDVFRAVGLPYIPPELREASGEIEAAEKGKLPHLIERKDIRGDLQMHTKYSDGSNTIEEMVEACRKLGYSYLAITDHSQAVRVAGGLSPAELEKQIAEIRKIQKKYRDIRILAGIECDILPDGRLDLPESLLRKCDLVVGAVHSKFNLSREEMTRRILKAFDTGLVHIFAHPTGRIINRRAPYAVDIAQLIRKARERNIALELNAFPDRLDLPDIHLRAAKDAGVKISINTDSHNALELENIRYGIAMARRGWLEAGDCINTYTFEKLMKFLKR